MVFVVFDYDPTAQNEHANGIPASEINDQWLEQEALHRDCTVEDLTNEIAAYKRSDGEPLYAMTSYAKTKGFKVAPATKETDAPAAATGTATSDTPTASFTGPQTDAATSHGHTSKAPQGG